MFATRGQTVVNPELTRESRTRREEEEEKKVEWSEVERCRIKKNSLLEEVNAKRSVGRAGYCNAGAKRFVEKLPAESWKCA